MDAETKKRVEAFLEHKGLRWTGQREAIVETAFGTTDHFTAEELLAMVRRMDSSVSRATVYRTLSLLTESGLIHELHLEGKDQKVYDPNYSKHPNHAHIICNDCDKIVEFESKDIERLENQISESLGFSISSQRLEIHANCEDLKKKGVCANQACEKKKEA
ncbi:MAG: transcriptional repressor [Verrucomicrobiae bacterium]|nr:transcriptional repressor [Verrucomicrobiae bacterium]